MLFAAKGKIYSTKFNGKVYPELKLKVDKNGNRYLEQLTTGVAKKPTDRQVLTLEEVLVKVEPEKKVE